MVQSHNLKRRLEKIENKLESEKGQWLRLPDGEGGYIEVPGCQTWMDMVAMSITSNKRLDETEQN